MTPDWRPLEAELDRLDHPLPFWWRDDDAVDDTPQIDRLIAMAEDAGVPLHLAIIPADLRPALIQRLRHSPDVIPVTHGWAHQNHAPKGEKKSEFGAHRPLDVRLTEARRGLATLRDHLTPAPMFVPPWNRIGADLLPHLLEAGFTQLSTFTPRKSPFAAPGLTLINTHLDPIDWRGNRSLADPQSLIDQIARQLADRRLGTTDATEPYGLLTHHLVHDDAIWTFTAELLARLTRAPLAPWRADIPLQNGDPT